MFLKIDDFSWYETADEVVVEVPLRGMNVKSSDVLTTSQYIKVSTEIYTFGDYCAIYIAIYCTIC